MKKKNRSKRTDAELKAKLLEMAANGEPRPDPRSELGRALARFTDPTAKAKQDWQFMMRCAKQLPSIRMAVVGYLAEPVPGEEQSSLKHHFHGQVQNLDSDDPESREVAVELIDCAISNLQRMKAEVRTMGRGNADN